MWKRRILSAVLRSLGVWAPGGGGQEGPSRFSPLLSPILRPNSSQTMGAALRAEAGGAGRGAAGAAAGQTEPVSLLTEQQAGPAWPGVHDRSQQHHHPHRPALPSLCPQGVGSTRQPLGTTSFYASDHRPGQRQDEQSCHSGVPRPSQLAPTVWRVGGRGGGRNAEAQPCPG